MEKRLTLVLITTYTFLSMVIFGAVNIKDLSPSASGYKAVANLVEKKIMDIDASGNFKPSLLVTKLDLARYLYNLIDYYNLDNLSAQLSSQRGTVSVEDLRKLESRISGIERNVQNLQSFQNDLNELKKRLDSLERKVSGTDTSKDTTVVSLQKDISDLKNKNADLEKQIAALQKSIQDFQRSIQVSLQQIPKSQTDIKELKDKLSVVETKVQTIEKYYADVITESSKNTALRMEFETIKSDLKKTTDVTNNKIDSIEKTLNTLLQDHVSKTTFLSTEISKISGRVNTLDALSNNQSQELKDINDRLKTIEDKLNKLDSVFQDNISKTSTLENEIKNIKNQFERRLSKLEEIINKTDDFVKRIEAVDVITVANTFSNIQLLTNRFDQLELRLSELEKKDALSTETLINELNGLRTENKDNLSKLENNISELKTKQDSLTGQLSTDKREIDNLRNELNITRWLAIIGLTLSVILSIILALQ